ncbi:MAG TPA: c-type cytochrome [Croceibacterium sp.]|nr:c-type cytochrome [Croceibacterium sp.]
MKALAPPVLLAVAACIQAAEPAVDAATLAAGERAYQKCYACHSLDGPDPSTQGPSLKGLVGRPVAAEPGFAYSPALRAYAAERPVWTREALDAFIADPQAVVPDNEMGFFGIRNADERRALIEYLARS